MQSTTWFDSENNSRYALQKAMHLKLKNSWKSEIQTWNFPITFCSWVYAIQSSDQHTFQKTFCSFCSCHWLNLIGSSVDPMQLLDTILYWQQVKNNYRLRTGSVFNYCFYLGAPVDGGGCEYLSRCKIQIVLGQVWRSHKMQLTILWMFQLPQLIYNYKLQMRIWN